MTGSANGGPPATDATFFRVQGIAFHSGTTYIADGAQCIREISAAGVVSTLAGDCGQRGFANGSGATARFNQPAGIAVDSVGDVYVADSENAAVRMISPSGVVSTLAGGPGVGTFVRPEGLALNAADTELYVSDTFGETIKSISVNSVVTVVNTLAGSAGVAGSTDGSASEARFNWPEGLAFDSSGNLFIADANNAEIRELNLDVPNPLVSTIAGVAGSQSVIDGSRATARFDLPVAIATDGSNFVVADDDTVRLVTPAGVVTTIAGSPGVAGFANGPGATATFESIASIAVAPNGSIEVGESTDLRGIS